MTAKAEVRAKRRYLELLSRGQNADEKEILAQIVLRDEQDAKREFAPLKKAADAIEIDTSEMSVEEVVKKIENVIGGEGEKKTEKSAENSENTAQKQEKGAKKKKKAYSMTIPANKKGSARDAVYEFSAGDFYSRVPPDLSF